MVYHSVKSMKTIVLAKFIIHMYTQPYPLQGANFLPPLLPFNRCAYCLASPCLAGHCYCLRWWRHVAILEMGWCYLQILKLTLSV